MSVLLNSPVAFQLGSLEIRWYGIIIAAAVVLAIALACRIARLRGLTVDNVIDFALVAVPLGVICARLYYVIFSWDEFIDNPVDIIWIQKGGLAIYGAVIGGVLAAFIYSKIKKINVLAVLDVAAPVVVLAQCIGRWGNFANQEAFGRPVVNQAMQWFPYAVFIEDQQRWFQATFFYESLWCLIVCGILFSFFLGLGPIKKLNRSWAVKRGFDPGPRALPAGNIAFMYLALYGLGRAFIEPLRSDALIIGSSLRVSYLLSIILVVGGAIGLYMNYRHGQPATELPKNTKVQVRPVIKEEPAEMDDDPEDADA